MITKFLTIGKTAEVGSSKRIFANEYTTNGIPFFRSKEVGELSRDEDIKSELFISEKRYLEIKDKFGVPQNGDLLLTSVGSIGNTWIVDDRKFYFKDGNITYIRPSSNLDVKYLKYFFKSNLFWNVLSSNSTGTAYSALTISKIIKIKIPLPPLPQQKKIATILDEADKVRQINRRLLEKYDALTESLFLEMFGDLIKNSRKWDIVKFGDVTTSILGRMLDKKRETGNHLKPYLKNNNVKWFHFDFSNLSEMDFDEKSKKKYDLQYGDILVCEGGEVGRAAIWKNELIDCYFQKALHRVRVNSKKLNQEYLVRTLYFYGKHGGFRKFSTTATISLTYLGKN